MSVSEKLAAIVADARRRVSLPVKSNNAQVILSYHEAIGRLNEQLSRGVFSDTGREAATRLIHRYEDRISMLATPYMVSA